MAQRKPHLFHITSGISHSLAEGMFQRMNPALCIRNPGLFTVGAVQPINLNPR